MYKYLCLYILYICIHVNISVMNKYHLRTSELDLGGHFLNSLLLSKFKAA